MSDLLAQLRVIYSDPIFLLYTGVVWLVSVAAFFVFAVPFTIFAWLDPKWARRYRIQSRRPDLKPLLWPSIRSFFVNHAYMIALMVVSWPLVRLCGLHVGPIPPWYTIVWQVLFCLFIDDFVYYFMHRVLHTRWLFKKVHSLHHGLHTPWAITAHYMHPAEFVLTGLTVLLGPIILGPHVVTLWAWIVVREWVGVDGHCAYKLPINPMRIVPGYFGPVFHDFHHSKCNGNYSGALGWLDGVLGTYAPGYKQWSPPFTHDDQGSKAHDGETGAAE